MLFNLALSFLLYDHLFEQMSARSRLLLATHTTRLSQFSSLSWLIVYIQDGSNIELGGLYVGPASL